MQFDHLKRREFITLLGGAAAWPLAARAQQPAMPVVGLLSVTSDEERTTAAVHRGLNEAGYVEGCNVAIEYRWANNQLDKLPDLATDLVSRRVAVIFAIGGAASARAAKAATASIPVVFVIGQDPIAMGLVTSFNRPGGNVTGVTFTTSELTPKGLGLLNELVPGSARYALLVDPNAPQTGSIIAELRKAALNIGRQIEVFAASSPGEIDTAFADLVQKGTEALVVGSSSLYVTRRIQLTTLAAIHRLPAIYYDRLTAEAGGLVSYSASLTDAFRQVGVYAGKILSGAKPADLPVQQPTKFELVMNLKTAKVLGLTIPPSLLALADEVIE